MAVTPTNSTRAVATVIAHPEALPLLGQPGGRNRTWVLASNHAPRRKAIADCAERLAANTRAVSVHLDTAEAALRDKE